tara:strand:- start:741 stop:1346 length:606 start_codon:yes stop_codon:yes gene_type:complete
MYDTKYNEYLCNSNKQISDYLLNDKKPKGANLGNVCDTFTFCSSGNCGNEIKNKWVTKNPNLPPELVTCQNYDNYLIKNDNIYNRNINIENNLFNLPSRNYIDNDKKYDDDFNDIVNKQNRIKDEIKKYDDKQVKKPCPFIVGINTRLQLTAEGDCYDYYKQNNNNCFCNKFKNKNIDNKSCLYNYPITEKASEHSSNCSY